MFKPQRLGTVTIPDAELTTDKKNCKKIGPCGVGEKAIYLNSFYFDRRYYIPISSIERIRTNVEKETGDEIRNAGFAGIKVDEDYRRYYIPISSVERIFKRIAMSKGGFTGKGAFGTLSYLVVVYENGKEKQCNFKHEEDVDRLLAYIEERFPQIPLHSIEAERKLKEENGWKKSSASAFFRKKSKSGLPSLNAQKIILKSNPITTWI